MFNWIFKNSRVFVLLFSAAQVVACQSDPASSSDPAAPVAAPRAVDERIIVDVEAARLVQQRMDMRAVRDLPTAATPMGAVAPRLLGKVDDEEKALRKAVHLRGESRTLGFHGVDIQRRGAK